VLVRQVFLGGRAVLFIRWLQFRGWSRMILFLHILVACRVIAASR